MLTQLQEPERAAHLPRPDQNDMSGKGGKTQGIVGGGCGHDRLRKRPSQDLPEQCDCAMTWVNWHGLGIFTKVSLCRRYQIHYSRFMELLDATQTFTALGHPGRLSVFRMLMRLAPQGARPTEIANVLSMVPNTLSHHLAELERCGLIRVARQGRSLFYSVDLGRAEALVDYLFIDCCRGLPVFPWVWRMQCGDSGQSPT